VETHVYFHNVTKKQVKNHRVLNPVKIGSGGGRALKCTCRLNIASRPGLCDLTHFLDTESMASSLCSLLACYADVSEDLSASFIRVTRIGELGTAVGVTSTDARCEIIPLGIYS
jgi:hypothetical protein